MDGLLAPNWPPVGPRDFNVNDDNDELYAAG